MTREVIDQMLRLQLALTSAAVEKHRLSLAFEAHEKSLVGIMSSAYIDKLVWGGEFGSATKLVMLYVKPYHVLAPLGSLPPLLSIETFIRCYFEKLHGLVAAPPEQISDGSASKR